MAGRVGGGRVVVSLTRAVSVATVPVAIVANIGAFLLGWWILSETQLGGEGHLDAWRLVTVIILMGGQGLWLVWLRRQALGTLLASLLLWQLALLVAGPVSLAVQPGVMLAVFSYTAERSGRLRALVITFAVILTAAAFLLAENLSGSADWAAWQTPSRLVWAGMLAAGTVALPAILGAWYAQLRDRAERIADLAQRATSEEAARTAAAVAAERRTLAQEIHDTSSGHLTAILALSAAAHSAEDDPDAQHDVIHRIADEGQALFEGFERMLNSLRQEDRTITGTHQPGSRSGQHSVADMVALIEDHRRGAGVAVDFRFDPDVAEIDSRLGPLRSHTAYRVVQEALSNARKHAPGAALRVTIEDDEESLLIQIRNDAPLSRSDPSSTVASYAPPLSLGYGLDGVRDRLTAVGGQLRTGPTQQGGWRVNALLPHPPRPRMGRVRGVRASRAGAAVPEAGALRVADALPVPGALPVPVPAVSPAPSPAAPTAAPTAQKARHRAEEPEHQGAFS